MPDFFVEVAHFDSDRQACYAIREAVFVQEQNVPAALEMDEYDATATHFLLRDAAGTPLATARLLDKHGVAKIGRVAVIKPFRGRGLGLVLMRAVVDEARRRGLTDAVLDSQTYAIPFYERLGFAAEGDEFDDAGIPHFRMRRKLSSGSVTPPCS
ncbi:MAG: GNAT family N-acetyltransferase [Armatimonadota bacterium]|nr:GNAT family N-acetyltransferase [Armatimonadota bacterium]